VFSFWQKIRQTRPSWTAQDFPLSLWDKYANSMFFLAQKITTLFWPFDKNESDKLGAPWPLPFGREHLDKNLLSL
jgi:hypothetical protein